MIKNIDIDALIEALYDADAISARGAKIIREFPVVERKRGTWIVDHNFGNDIMSNSRMVICSVCRKGFFWGKQNFCPNCGARMKGG